MTAPVHKYAPVAASAAYDLPPDVSERQKAGEKSDMLGAARYASKFFRVFNALKARHGLEFEDIVIFFGLGRLNFDPTQGAMMLVKPINILSLAEFLLVPRETLRRKLMRLEEKDLVQRTSYGFVVKDMAMWRRLADLPQSGSDLET